MRSNKQMAWSQRWQLLNWLLAMPARPMSMTDLEVEDYNHLYAVVKKLRQSFKDSSKSLGFNSKNYCICCRRPAIEGYCYCKKHILLA